MPHGVVMLESEAIRFNFKPVKHSRSEKNSFSTVLAGIGSKFSFCQLEHRLTRVREAEGLRNPGKNTYAIIRNDDDQIILILAK